MKYLHKVGPASAGIAFACGHHCAALVVGILFTVLGRVEAATVNAASPSFADVSTAIALAAKGDTVVIPAGTATWTNTLTITKAITLQGAGVGVTVIRDGVQSGKLIQWSLPAGLPSRLTGIEFQDGGRSTYANAPGGILHIDGHNTDGSSFRFDHCKWNDLNGPIVPDTVIGVFDHNTFIRNTRDFQQYIYGSRWNDQGTYGDGSWVAPIGFGSSQFLFIEDNTITNTGGGTALFTDALAGARFCLRHNTVNNAFFGDHGTESGGRIRGSRAMEVYNNVYHGSNNTGYPPGGARSSTALFHDNTMDSGYGQQWILNVYRSDSRFPVGYNGLAFGGATGMNRWDVNDPTTFFSGTAASAVSPPAADASATVTVSGSPGWSTNQWVNYTLVNLSAGTGFNFGRIRSNTANTITYATGDYERGMGFAGGNSLQIHKVIQAIDAPGRGGGSLIDPANPQPTPPAGWNNQNSNEPNYSWNNTWNNAPSANTFLAHYPYTRAGEHYFDNTSMPGYTPYIYPHPLVSGVSPTPTPSPSPAPPLNLHVVSGP